MVDRLNLGVRIKVFSFLMISFAEVTAALGIFISFWRTLSEWTLTLFYLAVNNIKYKDNKNDDQSIAYQKKNPKLQFVLIKLLYCLWIEIGLQTIIPNLGQIIWVKLYGPYDMGYVIYGKGFNPWHVALAFHLQDRRMKSSKTHFFIILKLLWVIALQ